MAAVSQAAAPTAGRSPAGRPTVAILQFGGRIPARKVFRPRVAVASDLTLTSTASISMDVKYPITAQLLPNATVNVVSDVGFYAVSINATLALSAPVATVAVISSYYPFTFPAVMS